MDYVCRGHLSHEVPLTCGTWVMSAGATLWGTICRGHLLHEVPLTCGTWVMSAGATCYMRYHWHVGHRLSLPGPPVTWGTIDMWDMGYVCRGHLLHEVPLTCGTWVMSAGATCHGVLLTCDTRIISAGATCYMRYHWHVGHRLSLLGPPVTWDTTDMWHLGYLCRGHLWHGVPLTCGTWIISAGATCDMGYLWPVTLGLSLPEPAVTWGTFDLWHLDYLCPGHLLHGVPLTCGTWIISAGTTYYMGYLWPVTLGLSLPVSPVTWSTFDVWHLDYLWLITTLMPLIRDTRSITACDKLKLDNHLLNDTWNTSDASATTDSWHKDATDPWHKGYHWFRTQGLTLIRDTHTNYHWFLTQMSSLTYCTSLLHDSRNIPDSWHTEHLRPNTGLPLIEFVTHRMPLTRDIEVTTDLWFMSFYRFATKRLLPSRDTVYLGNGYV